jgi:predicted negative regulator of RcsB-dependent stress response
LAAGLQADASGASGAADAGAGAAGPDAPAYSRNGIKIWFPDQIPLPELASAGSYAAQAEKLSVERGADVVLYGTVECNGPRLSVVPRFAIAPAYMDNTPELHGTYELGSFGGAINQLNASTALAELRSEIAERASAMALLIQGFQYHAYDNQESYLKAAGVFSRIINEAAPANPHIRAIAEVFLGSANLKAANGDCQGNLEPAYLEAAQRAYESALADEPQMALAYLGLGYVMNQRAFYLAGDDLAVVMANLDKGHAYFNAAAVAQVRPSTANIGWKVLYGLAQARLIEREFTDDARRASQLLDEAEVLAHQMLSNHRADAATRAFPDSLAALTYLMLGDIQAQRFNSDGARSAYEMAAQYARGDAKLRVLIAVRLAGVVNDLGDVCGAGRYYQQAYVDAVCPADKLEYATLARDFQMQCESLAAGE